jgi:myo-inositol-1(or 4)-monophosphatase
LPAHEIIGVKADHAILREAACEAGELAAKMFKRGVETWDKADKTPVTEADLAVNDLLHARLTSARPDYGWLSEETADDPARLTRNRTWVIDPIDGTRGFVRGNDEWCVSVGLVEDGLPIAGVIVRPQTGDVYEAIRGGGAILNGNTIKANQGRTIPDCRFIMHEHVRTSRKWDTPWPPLQTSMSTSMALRLCYVAAGNVDATISISGKCDWDLAAADILVHEAGGQVTSMTGDSLRYNQPKTRHQNILAAGNRLHKELLPRTRTWKRVE